MNTTDHKKNRSIAKKFAFLFFLLLMLIMPFFTLMIQYKNRDGEFWNKYIVSDYFFWAAPILLLEFLAIWKKFRTHALIGILFLNNLLQISVIAFFNSHPSDDDALAMGLIYPMASIFISSIFMFIWLFFSREEKSNADGNNVT